MSILAAATAHRGTPAGTAAADCCVWLETVVVEGLDLRSPTLEERAVWRIFDPDGDERTPIPADLVWGPPLAAFRAGAAVELVDHEPPPGSWGACQGWRTLRPDGSAGAEDEGHSFLWYACAPGVGVLVDSSRRRGPRLQGWSLWQDLERTYRAGITVGVLRRPVRRR